MPNLGVLLLSLIPGLAIVGAGVGTVFTGALTALAGLGLWLATLPI